MSWPPTRGSPANGCPGQSCQWSIPAHAGEPSPALSLPLTVGVYPRPRGGALANFPNKPGKSGLSPPTRGSHELIAADDSVRGSIPAHAGEPFRSRLRLGVGQVYPRPRGGANRTISCAMGRLGLSPPTRGSHYSHKDAGFRRRSIPAHAGEPFSRAVGGFGLQVYPRPRGGARSKPPL